MKVFLALVLAITFSLSCFAGTVNFNGQFESDKALITVSFNAQKSLFKVVHIDTVNAKVTKQEFIVDGKEHKGKGEVSRYKAGLEGDVITLDMNLKTGDVVQKYRILEGNFLVLSTKINDYDFFHDVFFLKD